MADQLHYQDGKTISISELIIDTNLALGTQNDTKTLALNDTEIFIKFQLWHSISSETRYSGYSLVKCSDMTELSVNSQKPLFSLAVQAVLSVINFGFALFTTINVLAACPSQR